MTSKDKFLNLWERVGAEGNGFPVFQCLKKLYRESHRKYHNSNHIHYCLEQFEYVRHLPNDQEAVEMAIWFHDTIYNPKYSNNEMHSAKFALNVLRLGKLPDSFNMRVYVLIMYTRHLKPSIDYDAQILTDIDLSSLGKPWKEFILDTRRIREEYSHISEKDFRIGRVIFFRKFLKRPTIYLMQYFHDKYEAQARENLERWIREFGSL